MRNVGNVMWTGFVGSSAAFADDFGSIVGGVLRFDDGLDESFG